MKQKALLLCCVLSGLTAPLTVHSSIQPEQARLMLPAEWSLTPLMAPTLTMGLRVTSYIINENEQRVRTWRDASMQSCRLPAVTDEDDDWHCLDQGYIYSLLWREEGFIWVVGERLSQPGAGAAQHSPLPSPDDLNAQVISHSETPFESVTVLHSRRSLYGLQHDLQRLHHAQGARLLVHEQDTGGFILQWQLLRHKVTYTAQKDDQGDVLLVKVRGTNL